jgi:hypothetical protein
MLYYIPIARRLGGDFRSRARFVVPKFAKYFAVHTWGSLRIRWAIIQGETPGQEPVLWCPNISLGILPRVALGNYVGLQCVDWFQIHSLILLDLDDFDFVRD